MDKEPLPTYEDSAPGPSSRSHPGHPATNQQATGPTVKDPFNFPLDEGPPSYSKDPEIRKPVAIPQLHPDPAAPFVVAYAPILLRHGITPETWHPFVNTVSAFLTAKVSERAIAHAGNIARHVGTVPKSFGNRVGRNAESVGRHIADNAKRGNLFGVAFGIVGGAISLTLGTAASAVGSILALPATALNATFRKPKTPRERAVAYVAVANKNWLNARRLHA